MNRIRLAVPDDAGGMLDIYAPFVRDTVVTFEYEVPSLEQFRERIETTLPRYPWLALEQEGQVTGYAYAGRYQSRAAYQWDAESSIYLAPAARGKGLAAPLYRCLMALLEAQGVRNLYGCIAHPNPASERFHRKLGFRDLAVYPQAGYKQGEWRDILWNWLPLGEKEEIPPPLQPFGKLEPEQVAAILERYHQDLLGKG